jgi:dUTPase
MPPQGIVQVVSKEQVKLPSDMTGLAYVKTRLCNEGLLTLNIGIIDPGYEGNISSLLVNFSNRTVVLCRGQTFLRLQFMPMDDHSKTLQPTLTHQAYMAKLRVQSGIHGSSFLNLEVVVNETTKKIFSQWRAQIFTVVGAIALILTFCTFLYNFASLYVARPWLQPAEVVKANLLRGVASDETAALMKSIDELKARINLLEAKDDAIVPNGSKP